MLKLMIAEDEALERKSLNFLVTKFYSEKIIIISETSNGREIVQKALANKPDIILMDIHMPEMNGLEAAKKIKEELPDTEILILTAYNYFDYAKSAIRIGISDYLVKPYPTEKFCEAIDIIIQKIVARKSKLREEERISNKIKIMGNFLEKELILQIIHDTNAKSNHYDQFKEFFNIKQEKFACLIIRAENNDQLDDSLLDKIKSKINNIVSVVLGYVFVKDIVLFIFDDNLQSILFSEKFAKKLNELKNNLEEKHSLSLNIGLGKVYQEFSGMLSTFKEAQTALKKEVKSEKINNNFIQILYEKELVFCEKVVNEDQRGAIMLLDDIFHYWLEYYHALFKFDELLQYTKQLVFLLERNIIQFFGNNEMLISHEAINKEFDKLIDLKDIKNYLSILIAEIVNKISEHKKDRIQVMISLVKEYLEKNYMKPELSLNEVADYISISSFYLSKCFKKSEGVNFKEYLIKLRLDKAKRLMREERKTVQEAAFTVGYTDPNYFSKAFKKFVGISPKEFVNR